MIQLSQKDLIIIKQSQNWASRSISKLKSLSDRKFGSNLRDILNSGVSIRDQLRDIWDDLVSRETTLDNKALNTFVALRHQFDVIKTTIVNIIVPKLAKDGVDIRGYYKAKEIPEDADDKKVNKAKDKPRNDKDKYLNFIGTQIADISAVAPKELFAQQREALDKLNVFNEMLKKENNETKYIKLYEDATNIYTAYKELITNFMSKNVEESSIEDKKSQTYSALIKNANNIEAASYYYLLALSEYGSISTRLKDVSLPVKQVIPFVREKSDIYTYRKAAIQSTKELMMSSKDFMRGIQGAIIEKDALMKWVAVIEAFNAFADQYNLRLTYYSGFYDILSIKARQDKMLKSKKAPKVKGQEYSLGDFSEYNWSELPNSSQYKFKPIEKIRF